MEKKRTLTQNKALHLYFRLLAEELNKAGLDMKKVLNPGVEIPWNEKSVKEFLWRPIQDASVQKESTTQIETKEIDKVYDILNRHIGEKFGVHVPFPSEEELIHQRRV